MGRGDRTVRYLPSTKSVAQCWEKPSLLRRRLHGPGQWMMVKGCWSLRFFVSRGCSSWSTCPCSGQRLTRMRSSGDEVSFSGAHEALEKCSIYTKLGSCFTVQLFPTSLFWCLWVRSESGLLCDGCSDFCITLQRFLSCLWRNSYKLQTSILRKLAFISVICVRRQESTRGLGRQLGGPVVSAVVTRLLFLGCYLLQCEYEL